MSEISTEDAAYEAIAKEILFFVGDKSWERAGGQYAILHSMVSSEWWIEKNNIREEKGEMPPVEISLDATAAVRFLRAYLLRTTGQRIWGLTFTLFPDGQFRIDYDYNKPSDYEESNETVEVDLNKGILG